MGVNPPTVSIHAIDCLMLESGLGFGDISCFDDRQVVGPDRGPKRLDFEVGSGHEATAIPISCSRECFRILMGQQYLLSPNPDA